MTDSSAEVPPTRVMTLASNGTKLRPVTETVSPPKGFMLRGVAEATVGPSYVITL